MFSMIFLMRADFCRDTFGERKKLNFRHLLSGAFSPIVRSVNVYLCYKNRVEYAIQYALDYSCDRVVWGTVFVRLFWSSGFQAG